MQGDSPSAKTTRFWTGAVLVVTVTALGVVLWSKWERRHRNMADEVLKWEKASISGDTGTLYHMLFDYERDGYHLSTEQLVRLQREFFLPKVKGARIVSVLDQRDLEAQPGDVDAFIDVRVDCGGGKYLKTGDNMWSVNGRGKNRMIAALCNAWLIEDCRKNGPGRDMVQVWLDGIRRDSELLDSIGVAGCL